MKLQAEFEVMEAKKPVNGWSRLRDDDRVECCRLGLAPGESQGPTLAWKIRGRGRSLGLRGLF